MLAVPPRCLCDPLTGEPSIAYQYDGQGRETSIVRDGAMPSDDSTIAITYDALGRRASETQNQGGGEPVREVAWLELR